MDPHEAEFQPAASEDVFRLQAEEHPLIDDAPPLSPEEHCLRLVHLKAYEEAAAHAAGLDVLDVGCNTGYGTVRFVPVARRVVGVDLSPRAIETARQRLPNGGAEFIVIEGERLPFPDGTFDLVTAFQVLEHVPDAPAFLRELRRVLRPDGRVILTTPNAAIRLYPGMRPWNRFHVREYLAEELRQLLEGEFDHVRVRGMFGTATLYETEIRRVDAARRSVVQREARERAKSARAAEMAARRRRLHVRVARAVLPDPLRARIRARLRRPSHAATAPAGSAGTSGVLPTPSAAAPMDLDTFLRFSLADLFYADTDLDRAMDFLATCGTGGGASEDDADAAHTAAVQPAADRGAANPRA